ncbi:MAG: ABC transporter substrate-binding protein [Oscillospiraceae bacterium]|jgi:peptide/nickel transport system substrate-binding protein|nr:ABC transporter substrate-binding protein [Oscillospiraceae bacterium]
MKRKFSSAVLAALMALCLVLGTASFAVAESAAIPSELPRNETLYFAGQQWGSVVGWSIFMDSANNAMAIAEAASRRIPVNETLYMYNLLDGKVIPLLADGDYQWNDDQTEITVKINPAAHFSDGTPVKATDVAYTYDTHIKYQTANGVNFPEYIAEVSALDEYTVVFKAALNDSGAAKNPLEVVNQLLQIYIWPQSYIEKLEERNNYDAAAFKLDTAEDFIASGPYAGGFYADDQKVILARDDNYWGVAIFGSLPAPKYLAHNIYPDNPAGQVALAAGEVDVCQQFIADVQLLWEEQDLPISTYIDEPPYGICVSTPSAFYNFNNPILANNVAIRKAIALAVDYDQINANAMTYQSPTFVQSPRSLMIPTDGEQAMYDHEAVKDLQWIGNDIEGANKLLDEAGIVDTNGDGIRDIDGKNLSFNAVCPNGWTDWMASMEIVAAAGKGIGIEITTLFPEWSEVQNVFTDGTQTSYDIFMYAGDGAGPTYPWQRVRQRMSSEFIGRTGNWSGNWGQYSNPRADEIIQLIPSVTDPDELKALYTEAVEIYLTDVPSFALMYRPQLFYTVNESVWTGYPEQGDGYNIPPTDLTDGYGIAGLYHLELVNP